MAEAIARYHLEQGLLGAEPDVFVASAGISAGAGSPISPETIATLKALGIEHDGRSKPLKPEMIRKADVIFCMTEAHARAARELVGINTPDARKVHRLDPAADIEDPIGLGQDAYDSVAQTMMTLIPRRLTQLLKRETPTAGEST